MTTQDIFRWFTLYWYQYLFANQEYDAYNRYRANKPKYRWPGWVKLICRMRGHPCGPVFYNAGGDEPDGSCRNCGDDIGCC
jgi:hypothetical protein